MLCGDIVIYIPIILINVTTHNTNDTDSFKIKGAKINTNIGIVKLIVVAIAT